MQCFILQLFPIFLGFPASHIFSSQYLCIIGCVPINLPLSTNSDISLNFYFFTLMIFLQQQDIIFCPFSSADAHQGFLLLYLAFANFFLSLFSSMILKDDDFHSSFCSVPQIIVFAQFPLVLYLGNIFCTQKCGSYSI